MGNFKPYDAYYQFNAVEGIMCNVHTALYFIELQLSTSIIIYQTFQDAESMEKDITKLQYPRRFKITLFRQLPKAELNTFYEIWVQSERALSTVNVHVPGMLIYMIILL